MKVNSRFIVVKHDAKKARLHYDLRFRMPRSKNWASFAVRKGVPTESGTKVLAIKTHDHSEEEALFLGTIKDGYGAGKLSKFDDGQCIIHKYHSGHMIIEFKGRKIKGIYHLINTGLFNKKDYKKQQYLLFKGSVVKESEAVVSSGRNTEEDEEEEIRKSDKLKWSIAKEEKSIWGPEYEPQNFRNKSVDAKGMLSSIFFPDSETDEETSDFQQTKPLKWSVTRPKRIVAAEQLYNMLKNRR